ncbi:MAG: glycoside hydrolase family 3 protein, partial [Lachnospiraceae bacterium]|nr:glycoside hydrolase family 3 protein [Lachnospiraceae bacterium]
GNMCEIGASGDRAGAYRAGRTIGGYLAELGFNLDFAPVADVWSNEKNAVVKYRSFGSDAQLVADMVREEIKGLEESGILSAVKHFPGHGSTAEDSHRGAAVVNRTLQELSECDFIPFQGAIEAGVPFVMVGHLSLPQVIGSDVPAILCKEIIGDILRKQLQFNGIVITDALDMGAVTDYYTSAEAAVLAVEAGADMLLMPENFQEAFQGILDAVKDGRLTEQRLDESVLRILTVKLRLEQEET